ncbi:unnamed protein product [Diamesa serratosioi]
MTLRSNSKASASSCSVLIYHDVNLKENDVDLLRGPYWLNDQIIAFYFLYLEYDLLREDGVHFLLVSPQVTQCLKIAPVSEANTFLGPLKPDKKRFMFFPINDNMEASAGGNHWSLLVFSRRENSFFGFDSLNNHNSYADQTMIKTLKVVLNCPTARYINQQCSQQDNTFDCGIHVICNIDNIIEHIVETGSVSGVSMVNYDSINNKRDDLLKIIEQLSQQN